MPSISVGHCRIMYCGCDTYGAVLQQEKREIQYLTLSFDKRETTRKCPRATHDTELLSLGEFTMLQLWNARERSYGTRVLQERIHSDLY